MYRRTVGRPRLCDERRITTAIRLPQSVHEALRRAAGDRDVSINLLVNRAVEDYLARLPTVDEALTMTPTPAREIADER